MKKFMTVLSVVLMAAGFVSCKKEINVYGPAPEKGELKVRFIADASLTKVGLTPDENDENFSAVWDKNDYIGIVCTDKNDSKVTDDEILACWVPSGDKSTPGYFETSLDATSLTEENAPYSFVGYWPQGIEVEDLFPGNRIQNGDKYNGDYDIMVSDKTAVNFGATETNAVTVVLPMKRQTSIAYFHIKSELNEKIVSATLTTGEGEFIAASNANLSGDGFSIDGCGENSITLRIEGDMYSSNFKLWFNVLPVDYTSMKLVVETENHSFTMSKKAAGSWKAGELNSVVIENVPADKWAVKETPSEPVEKTLSIADYASANKWENATQYLSIDIDENLTVKCAGSSNTGKYYNNNNTWRMYQTEKSKVTFTLSDGYKFQDAKIKYKVDNTGILVYDGTNVSSNTSLNVTDKTSFEFGVGNSGTATNGNIQIISIYVKYIKSDSGSFDPANPNYAISVVGNIVGGTVTPSRSYAKETEKFTVTCEPSIGYEYVSESLVVKNAVTGENLVADDNGEYTMPAANVNVSAEFSLIPTLSVTSPEPYASNLTNNGGNGFSIPVMANQAWAASIKEGDANDAGVILMQSEGEGGEDNNIIFKFDSQNTDVLNAKSTVITVGPKSGSRPEPIDITIVHSNRGAVLVLNNEDKANVTDNVAATDIAYTLNVTNANFSEWNVLEYTVAGEIQSADKYVITKTQDNTGSIKISFPANKDESSENTIIVKVGYEGIITRTLTLTQAAAQASSVKWVLVEDLTNLTEGTYILASVKSNNTWRYMPNTESSGTNPSLKQLTAPADNTIKNANVTSDMKWNLVPTGTANQYYIRPNGNASVGLGCTAETGKNIRISSSYVDMKWTFSTSKSANWQIKNDAKNPMYLAVYADDAWRNYTISTTNQNGKFYIFKQVSN